MGIKWESNAHNCLGQEPTGRTHAPNLNSILILDGTRQTASSGFVNRDAIEYLEAAGEDRPQAHLAEVDLALTARLAVILAFLAARGPDARSVPKHRPCVSMTSLGLHGVPSRGGP
jgi:hypothetical protein